MADLLKLKRELEVISKILSQSLDNINFEIENSHTELRFYSKYVKVQFVYLLSILYTTLLLAILYILMSFTKLTSMALIKNKNYFFIP